MSNPTDLQAFAHAFTDLLDAGDHDTAVNQHHTDDVVYVEACDFPGDDPHMKRVTEGLDAVKAGQKWWMDNHEVHGGETKGPFLFLPDRFGVYMTIDVTPKVGPTAGQR